MFTVLDKSLYLKGLLVLARKNNKIIENEKNIIRDAAKRLGFSKDFYEDTLRYLLANKYIEETPVKFSNPTIAKIFISEGIQLAIADNDFCKGELEWLRLVAQENELPENWLDEQIKNITQPTLEPNQPLYNGTSS